MRIASIAVLVSIALLTPATAASSTPHGQVSVEQVMEAIEAASAKPEAAQLLTAYLAGIGETAGILTASTDKSGHRFVTCDRPLAIDGASILAALKSAAPDRKTWTATPATPIIVASVIDRAGCK